MRTRPEARRTAPSPRARRRIPCPPAARWGLCCHTALLARQYEQYPHPSVEGMTTRSPTLRFLTSGPTYSTTPTPSWPRMVPSCIPARVPRTMCRSVPQIALEVSRTMASVGSLIFGSSTSSSLIIPDPVKDYSLHRRPPISGCGCPNTFNPRCPGATRAVPLQAPAARCRLPPSEFHARGAPCHRARFSPTDRKRLEEVRSKVGRPARRSPGSRTASRAPGLPEQPVLPSQSRPAFPYR